VILQVILKNHAMGLMILYRSGMNIPHLRHFCAYLYAPFSSMKL